MYDDTLRKEVEEFANYLDQVLLSSQMTLPSSRCELVLELRPADNGKTEWFVFTFYAWYSFGALHASLSLERLYYYVDHQTKSLFWLDTYSNPPFLKETKGVKTPSHMSEHDYHLFGTIYRF